MKKFEEGLAHLKNRINERIPAVLLKDRRFGLRSHLDKLEVAVKNISTLTEPGHLREQRLYILDQAEKVRALVVEAAKETEANFQKAARERSGMVPDKNFAVEIRSKFATLDPGERMKALQGFVKTLNGPGMAAIIDAPSFLTGLDPGDASKLSEQFFRATVPDLMADRDHYRDLLAHVNAGVKMAEDAAASEEVSRA